MRRISPRVAIALVAGFVVSGLTCSDDVPVPWLSAEARAAENGEALRRAPRTFWVDRNSRGGRCSDRRSAARAASPRTPWCSIRRAVAAAPSGSTVLVRGGSYPELVVENDRRRSRHVTLKRYRSAWVRLDGISMTNSTFLRFHGFRITDWVNFNDGTRRVELFRNDISPHGVRMKAVSGITIARNRIHDLARSSADKCGCAVWGQSWGDHGVRNVRIRGNVIRNIASDGVHFGNGRNVAIVNNVIADALNRGDGEHVDSIQIMRASPLVIRGNRLQNNQHGIMFTNLASNGVVIENNVVAQIRSYGINAGDIPYARIVNNTFWRNRYGAIILRDDERDDPVPVGVVFKNNIVDAQNSGDGWFAVHDYNLVAAGSRYGPHDRRGAARFVRALRGNFRLVAGSRGIDAGTSVGAPKRDRFGRARRDVRRIRNTGGGRPGYYDIGAHEH
jgi:hypothetical protein